jgi:predicted DCC family thiol-disulfide oxidoreductase YuxK
MSEIELVNPVDEQAPVLLYDGTCGLCSRIVQFVLRRDPGGRLRFASLQGEHARAAIASRPALRGVDSVIWLGSPDEKPLIRSGAALRAMTYLGGAWRLAGVLRLVPRGLRDWVYELVARHRHALAPADAACYVPPPEERHRFLD